MYLAIDIETTGLDPEQDQVLEIGAVLDYDMGILDCPSFEMPVKHDRVSGSPYAMVMNSELLARISKGEGMTLAHIGEEFDKWLRGWLPQHPSPVTLLGKNVGTFDWQFLKRLPGFPVDLISHRFLDVGSLYSTRTGMKSQSSLAADLAEQIGIPGEPHEALYDARVSLALARKKWSENELR